MSKVFKRYGWSIARKGTFVVICTSCSASALSAQKVSNCCCAFWDTRTRDPARHLLHNPSSPATYSLHPPALGGVSVMTNGNYRFVKELPWRPQASHARTDRLGALVVETSVKPAQFG